MWHPAPGEHGNAYDLRIDIKDPGNPLVDIQSNVVTVEVDNRAPVITLDFTSLPGDCTHLDEGAVFTGAVSVTDPHFGGFSFEILPSRPVRPMDIFPLASLYAPNAKYTIPFLG